MNKYKKFIFHCHPDELLLASLAIQSALRNANFTKLIWVEFEDGSSFGVVRNKASITVWSDQHYECEGKED